MIKTHRTKLRARKKEKKWDKCHVKLSINFYLTQKSDSYFITERMMYDILKIAGILKYKISIYLLREYNENIF